LQKGEHELVRGLSDLRRLLVEPPPEAVEEVMAPFLAVVVSPETTGPITGAALTSLSKLLKADYISPDNLKSGPAMQKVVEAVLNCQFEQSDVSGDEVVIGRIVEALQVNHARIVHHI
jgi:brefeldin A-resistance guanine nucleotide exchange factor 1